MLVYASFLADFRSDTAADTDLLGQKVWSHKLSTTKKYRRFLLELRDYSLYPFEISMTVIIVYPRLFCCTKIISAFAREKVFRGYFADSWTPHGMGMAWAMGMGWARAISRARAIIISKFWRSNFVRWWDQKDSRSWSWRTVHRGSVWKCLAMEFSHFLAIFSTILVVEIQARSIGNET